MKGPCSAGIRIDGSSRGGGGERPTLAPTREKRRARIHPGDVFAHDPGDRRTGGSAGGSDLRHPSIVAQKGGDDTRPPGKPYTRAPSGGRQRGERGKDRQSGRGG